MTHDDDDPFNEVTVLGRLVTETALDGTTKETLALADRHVEVLTPDGTHPSGAQLCQSDHRQLTLHGWVSITDDELARVTADLPD